MARCLCLCPMTLARRIAQLDYQAMRGVRLASMLVTALPPFVCVAAILLAGMRVNSEPDEALR